MAAGARLRHLSMYVLAGGLGIAGATVARAPASLVAWLVSSGSGGRVAIESPSGSFWAGQGDLVVQTAEGPVRVPNLSWTISAGRMWLGELAATLRAAGPEIAGSAEVMRGFHSVSFRNAQINAPMELFCRGLPGLSSLHPSGRLTIRASAIDVNPAAINGSADVLIEDAQAARFGSLGDYRVAFEGIGDGATLSVTTLRGPLHIVGNGDVTLSGQLRFRGQASVDPAQRARFAPALSFIGVPRPDGSVPLQWPLSGAMSGPSGHEISRSPNLA
jgi:hypothetical protein